MRIAKALDLPLLATNDLHYTYAEDAKAHEVLLCVQTGKTMQDDKRFRFDADDFYLKSAEEMAGVWSELPTALSNTLLVAERCNVEFTEGRNLMPRFPVPEGESEESWLVKEVERGLVDALPAGRARRPPRAGRLRGRRRLPDGLPRLLPGHRRPGAPRQEPGHPGRPGPRVGGRRAHRVRPGDHRARPDQARPAVRALPQPRPRLDARHRHGLRRAPAHRGDPLRHREVRRGAGRPDHHLRHHQGQGRGQGRRPRAGPAVRARRPDHQGDAPGGHGQGHLAGRGVRPRQRPLLRGRRVPGALRGRRGGPHGRRHRQGPRGAEAAVGRPRGRRHLVERAAPRRDPDPAPRAGRRDHHPARHGRLREARPAQDGLPGPAQPHRARRLPGPHQEQPRPGGRARDARPR